MADNQDLFVLTCAGHYDRLVSGLWQCFQASYGVDFEVQWCGQSIKTHRLILDLFLSPERLSRITNPSRFSDDHGSDSVDLLLEFLYKGQVAVPKRQLSSLLDVAREAHFDMLVNAVESVAGQDEQTKARETEVAFPDTSVPDSRAIRTKPCYVSLEPMSWLVHQALAFRGSIQIVDGNSEHQVQSEVTVQPEVAVQSFMRKLYRCYRCWKSFSSSHKLAYHCRFAHESADKKKRRKAAHRRAFLKLAYWISGKGDSGSQHRRVRQPDGTRKGHVKTDGEPSDEVVVRVQEPDADVLQSVEQGPQPVAQVPQPDGGPEIPKVARLTEADELPNTGEQFLSKAKTTRKPRSRAQRKGPVRPDHTYHRGAKSKGSVRGVPQPALEVVDKGTGETDVDNGELDVHFHGVALPNNNSIGAECAVVAELIAHDLVIDESGCLPDVKIDYVVASSPDGQFDETDPLVDLFEDGEETIDEGDVNSPSTLAVSKLSTAKREIGDVAELSTVAASFVHYGEVRRLEVTSSSEPEVLQEEDNSVTAAANSSSTMERAIMAPPKSNVVMLVAAKAKHVRLVVAREESQGLAGRVFHCHRCTRTFPQLQTLKNHVRIHELRVRYSRKRKTQESGVESEDPGEESPARSTSHGGPKRIRKISSQKMVNTVSESDSTDFRGNRYECGKCGEQCSSLDDLLIHKRVHTKKHVFKCLKCEASFSEESLFNVHGWTHLDSETIFACTECRMGFRDQKSLANHTRIHFVPSYKSKRLMCNWCDQRFQHPALLAEHEEVVHGASQIHVCPVCGKEFQHHPNMMRHRRNTHRNPSINSPGPFECALCLRTFVGRQDFDDHQETHADEIMCGHLKSNFSNGAMSSSPDPSYVCLECTKTFGSAEELTKHRSEHINEISVREGETGETEREVPGLDVLKLPCESERIRKTLPLCTFNQMERILEENGVPAWKRRNVGEVRTYSRNMPNPVLAE